LRDPTRGGAGLREWVRSLSLGSAIVPRQVPEAVIAVYLADPEARPHHDCEECGMAVPVRPGHGLDDELSEYAYFPCCPACGGKTGRYARLCRSGRPSVS